jgi:CheY-like chemotaxis protein
LTYKLLVADDSVTIQRVIELTFAEEDVKVSTVGDGQAAIDRLESDPPDIVLADIDMPKRDGYEVAAYVRSRPKLAHIPVVLLTGAFEPIDQARADAAGSSDVLAKPFEPQMVINRVKQLLGKKKAELEVPAPSSFAPAATQHDETPMEAPDGLKAPSAPRPPARSSMAMNDEHATQQNQPARPAPGQPAGQPPVSLDDYFDQLDAAFSNLPQPGAKAAQHDTMHAEEEWLDSQALDHQAGAVEPLIVPPPAPRPGAQPAVATLVAQPPPIARPEPAPMPPVQAAPPAPAPPTPAPPAVAAPATPVITDEVIEDVVARVLARLSDRVVRETVTEIVSSTAERLVQEEIARIKRESQ